MVGSMSTRRDCGWKAVAIGAAAGALAGCGPGTSNSLRPVELSAASATAETVGRCPPPSAVVIEAANKQAEGARIVSELLPSGVSGPIKEIVAQQSMIAAMQGYRAVLWDADLRPLVSVEIFERHAYLGIRRDGGSFVVAGATSNRPELLVDTATGRSRFVVRPQRFLYDSGVQQVTASGLPAMPWLAIDAYDLVLLDADLGAPQRLPRSKEQQLMVGIDKTVRKLDYMDARQGDRGELWDLQLTGDGSQALVLASNKKRSGSLLRWDMRTKKALPEVLLPPGLSPSRFVVSHDGSFAVVSGWSKTHNGTRMFKIQLTDPVVIDLGAADYGSDLALSTDGARLLAVSSKGARWWSMTANSPLEPVAALGAAQAAAITDRHVVLRKSTGLDVYDRQSLRHLRTLGARGPRMQTPVWLADGRLALRAGANIQGKGAQLYRWSPKQPELLESLGPAPHHVGVAADGKLAGLVSRSRCAHAQLLEPSSEPANRTAARSSLWKVCAAKTVVVNRFGRDPIVQAVDFPRERVAMKDGPLYVIDAKSGKRTELASTAGQSALRSTAFSPRGRYVTAVMAPKSLAPEAVGVWDAASGKLLHRLRVHKEFGGFPQVSRNEQRLVVVFGKQAHSFELPSGKKLKSVPLPGWALGLRYDPRLDLFEVPTQVGWQLLDADLKPAARWEGWRASPSYDGAQLRLLASGDSLLATLELTFSGHVIYTPRGSFAASGPPPQHVHLIYPKNGRTTLAQLQSHHNPGRIAQVLRDGSLGSEPKPYAAPEVTLRHDGNELSVLARSPTMLTRIVTRVGGRVIRDEQPCGPEISFKVKLSPKARAFEVVATDSRGVSSTATSNLD